MSAAPSTSSTSPSPSPSSTAPTASISNFPNSYSSFISTTTTSSLVSSSHPTPPHVTGENSPLDDQNPIDNDHSPSPRSHSPSLGSTHSLDDHDNHHDDHDHDDHHDLDVDDPSFNWNNYYQPNAVASTSSSSPASASSSAPSVSSAASSSTQWGVDHNSSSAFPNTQNVGTVGVPQNPQLNTQNPMLNAQNPSGIPSSNPLSLARVPSVPSVGNSMWSIGNDFSGNRNAVVPPAVTGISIPSINSSFANSSNGVNGNAKSPVYGMNGNAANGNVNQMNGNGQLSNFSSLGYLQGVGGQQQGSAPSPTSSSASQSLLQQQKMNGNGSSNNNNSFLSLASSNGFGQSNTNDFRSPTGANGNVSSNGNNNPNNVIMGGGLNSLGNLNLNLNSLNGNQNNNGNFSSQRVLSSPNDFNNNNNNNNNNGQQNGGSPYDSVDPSRGNPSPTHSSSSNSGSTSHNPCKLFIGQIPRHVSEADLHLLFDPFGTILELVILRDKSTSAHRGCAFLTYGHPESAEKAITSLNEKICLHNRPLVVRYAGHNGFIETKLFVGMIARSTTKDQLQDLFSAFGVIKEIYLMTDAKTQQSKGCAFVKYGSREEANRAIDALNNKYQDEGAPRKLIVRLADTKAMKTASQQLQSQGQNTPPQSAQMGMAMGNNGINMANLNLNSNNTGNNGNNNGSSNNLNGMGNFNNGNQNSFQQFASNGNNNNNNNSNNSAFNDMNPFLQSQQNHHGHNNNNNGQSPNSPQGPCNVYIYNLPPDYSDLELLQSFSPFGPIVSSKVYRDPTTGQSKGYGCVTFQSQRSVSKSILALDGTQVHNHTIRVINKRINFNHNNYNHNYGPPQSANNNGGQSNSNSHSSSHQGNGNGNGNGNSQNFNFLNGNTQQYGNGNNGNSSSNMNLNLNQNGMNLNGFLNNNNNNNNNTNSNNFNNLNIQKFLSQQQSLQQQQQQQMGRLNQGNGNLNMNGNGNFPMGFNNFQSNGFNPQSQQNDTMQFSLKSNLLGYQPQQTQNANGGNFLHSQYGLNDQSQNGNQQSSQNKLYELLSQSNVSTAAPSSSNSSASPSHSNSMVGNRQIDNMSEDFSSLSFNQKAPFNASIRPNNTNPGNGNGNGNSSPSNANQFSLMGGGVGLPMGFNNLFANQQETSQIAQ